MRNPKWHRDEIILALDLYFDKEIGTIDARNPKIIELSELLNKLPIFEIKPEEEKFRNPNGVTLKLSNFKAIDPDYSGKGMNAYSKLDKEIFEEFQFDKPTLKKIASQIKDVITNPKLANEILKIENDEISDFDSVREGQVLYKLHKIRERDRKIVEAKKKKIIQETGELKCEACGFSFELTYGEIGSGFIECHHLTPLSNFEVNKKTTLNDLALLCSNCHRMIHRDLSIKTIKDFKIKFEL